MFYLPAWIQHASAQVCYIKCILNGHNDLFLICCIKTVKSENSCLWTNSGSEQNIHYLIYSQECKTLGLGAGCNSCINHHSRNQISKLRYSVHWERRVQKNFKVFWQWCDTMSIIILLDFVQFLSVYFFLFLTTKFLTAGISQLL